MRLTFTFTLPTYLKTIDPAHIDPAAVREITQTAEDTGWDEIAVYDHFLEPPEWQPSYLTSWYDPIPLLGFLAAQTERISIAANAINIPYRHPAVMANELSTIDKLSGGRLCAALVAGYLHEEYDTLGLDRATRGQLADEYLDAMCTLWDNEVASYHGNFIHFDEVTLAARPSGRPEIWSHGGNSRALRRAIRWCDGWGPIVGPGLAMRSDDGSDGERFHIGQVAEGQVAESQGDESQSDEGAQPADPYAELVSTLNREHPGIHVPESKSYDWMLDQLDRERPAIEARERPLGLALGISASQDNIGTANEQIEEQIERGATKISVGIAAGSLDEFLTVERRFAEEIIPQYRD